MTGPTGSGKSTLARRLGTHLAVAVWPLDEMHWIRKPAGDERRDPESRHALLEQAVDRPDWIVEGVQFKWAGLAMERADLIIVLDPPRRVVLVRLFRRFLSRRFRGPRGTLRALAEELCWCRDWFRIERRMVLEQLSTMQDKTILYRDRCYPLTPDDQPVRRETERASRFSATLARRTKGRPSSR